MPIRFSILTITLNAVKFLQETLESTQQQTYPHVEHIVWDGGSTDGTCALVERFRHVRLYRGQDRGIADAMNQLAQYATGDFLLFLHADDRLASRHALHYFATAIQQYPTIEWLYGRASIIDANHHTQRITPIEPFTKKRLEKYNFLTHPATVVSRALYERLGGFDTSLRYCMDYDLWLRAAQHTTPLALPTVVASFREHLGSLSTSSPKQVADEAYRVRQRYVHGWQRWRSYCTWKKRCRAL